MTQASDIVAELDRLYTASVGRLQQALTAYLSSGTKPDPASRSDGSFAYPEIRLTYRGNAERPAPLRSFGRLSEPGDYRISIARPSLFADYLTEQLTLLMRPSAIPTILRRIDWLKIGMGAGQWAERDKALEPNTTDLPRGIRAIWPLGRPEPPQP